MAEKKSVWPWLAPALALWAAGLVLAGLYDLAIDQAIFSPHNPFAVVMEAVGWYPAFLSPILLMVLWAARGGSAPLDILRRVGAGLVALGGSFGILYSAHNYFHERGFLAGPGAVWVWVLLGALAVGLAALFAALWRAGAPLRGKLTFVFLWGTAYFIANEAAINAVKAIWQRTRFDDMAALGSFAHFTPWFLPFGHGGSSFPSGHTANAAGIFVLLLLCDVLPAWAKRRRLVTAACWAYIALMAFARVLIGRHFLSDTLAAAAIMAGLIFALRRLPVYQKSLGRIECQNAPNKALAAAEERDSPHDV